jgi:hypothetical protein
VPRIAGVRPFGGTVAPLAFTGTGYCPSLPLRYTLWTGSDAPRGPNAKLLQMGGFHMVDHLFFSARMEARSMFSVQRVSAGCLIGLLALGGISAVNGQSLNALSKIEFAGDLTSPDQLSGIALYRGLMVVCPDEGIAFNVLKKVDATHYQLDAAPKLIDDADAEIDLEGAASDEDYVYLIGSHSMLRKKVDEDRTYAKNRQRMADVQPHADSYRLFRLKLKDNGKIESKDEMTLKDLLEIDPLAAPFTKIPSKENGIDIEGIAVRDGQLYLGFRGPVLRDNYVPILAFKFDAPSEHELFFVPLGGRGIRDIVATSDGFLILAGPLGDGDGSYLLYHWNGKDCVPGEGNLGGRVVRLAEVPSANGAKPEGVTIRKESDDAWNCLIVCDGVNGAQEFSVARP